MATYDQFFKNLLREFFPDFLSLAAPDLVPRLRTGLAGFLDTQSFTDWPRGERREMDLLAEVPVVEGGPPVLVHVEIEARARRRTKERIWEYFLQLRLRHRLQVVPILVNLKGGAPGLTVETLEEGTERLGTVRFQYRCLSLSGCLAEDYLAKPEPLAWGLAALMRSKIWSRPQQKIECLRRIAAAEGLTDLRNFLLANCVETYLELSPRDAETYAALRQAEDNREVKTMEMTWADRIAAEGREEGLREGLTQGVRNLRQLVLRQLAQRFGKVPEGVRRRVEAIDSMEPLTRIAGEILVVRSLDEVRLE